MPSEIIRFEDYELDPAAFELRRAGSVVRLERIPFQLLLHLAQCRERVVTREEILDAIWGKNVFVDADNSINTAVRKIRQALKDDPDNPRFLRTVPGRGYRFAAEVAPGPPAAPPPLQEAVDRPPSGAAPAGKRIAAGVKVEPSRTTEVFHTDSTGEMDFGSGLYARTSRKYVNMRYPAI
jgi:DNA-binding winged helix-turn-helix (wHTH) protein